MSTPTTGQLPAGWYPDPSTPGQERWWDSAAWTSDVKPFPQPPLAEPEFGGQVFSPSSVTATVPPTQRTAPVSRWQGTDAGRLADAGADLASGKNTPATAGLTFGIISLFGGPIASILGLVFSIKGLARSKNYAPAGSDGIGHTKSIWGIVLSSVGIVVWVGIAIAALGSSGVQDGAGVPDGSNEVGDSPVADVSYLGVDLAADVTRALTSNGTVVTEVTCADTTAMAAGIITDCKGTVAGTPTGIRVTFDDAEGHFTLSEQAL